MIHLVLHQPEIPPNTGNIIRLAANSGMQLHLIKPMVFDMDHAKLRRAGLDYHEFAHVLVHESFADFLTLTAPKRVFAFTTKATRFYTDVQYQAGDALVFGSESKGLPAMFLSTIAHDQWLCMPMVAGGRSLNLSNAVATAAYEAWRQLGFVGARAPGPIPDPKHSPVTSPQP
jgi:tRNA (cytidine/uridine-2'-O-)-methyltransferase